MLKLMPKLVALLLAGLAFQLQAAEEQPLQIEGARTVTAEQLLELVDQFDDLVIIDARPQSDYDKGHIPEVIRLANTDTNAQTLAEVIPSKATPVLFYCNGVNCTRSGESVRVALQAGYQSIFWFRGGIAEWKAKGYPVES